MKSFRHRDCRLVEIKARLAAYSGQRRWHYLTAGGTAVNDGNNKDGSDRHNNTPHWTQPWRPHGDRRVFSQPGSVYKATTVIICADSPETHCALKPAAQHTCSSFHVPTRFPCVCVCVFAGISNCGSFDWQNRRQTSSGHANLCTGHNIWKTQMVCGCEHTQRTGKM